MHSRTVYKLLHAALRILLCNRHERRQSCVCEFLREKQLSSRSFKVPSKLSRPALFKILLYTVFLIFNIFIGLVQTYLFDYTLYI